MMEQRRAAADAMRHLVWLHRSSPEGLCLGCEELWARYVWQRDCPMVTFAEQVIASYARPHQPAGRLVGTRAA